MTVVIIALVTYGVSFLLSTLADYLINSHCEDPDTFYESLSDEFYTVSIHITVCIYLANSQDTQGNGD